MTNLSLINGRRGGDRVERILKLYNSYLSPLQDYREKKERAPPRGFSSPVEKMERGKREREKFRHWRVDCRGRNEKRKKEKKKKIGMKLGSGMFALPAKKKKKRKIWWSRLFHESPFSPARSQGKAKNESIPPPLPSVEPVKSRPTFPFYSKEPTKNGFFVEHPVNLVARRRKKIRREAVSTTGSKVTGVSEGTKC